MYNGGLPDTAAGLDDENSEGARERDRKFVTALARGLEVLRAFQPGGGILGNAELSEATGIPKSTVTRLTYTLTALGYLSYIKRLGKYELSPTILTIGYPFLSNLRVRHVAHDHMQQLADSAGGWVGLASRSGLKMIFVDACSANNITTLRLEIGSRISMVRSAIGRAFLGGISEQEREYFFDHFARRLGGEWPDMKRQVEESVAQIGARGFCLVDGEWHNDVRAVGAPLVSSDGKTVLAMNCGGPAFAVTVERLNSDLGPRLVHLCRSIAPFLT